MPLALIAPSCARTHSLTSLMSLKSEAIFLEMSPYSDDFEGVRGLILENHWRSVFGHWFTPCYSLTFQCLAGQVNESRGNRILSPAQGTGYHNSDVVAGAIALVYSRLLPVVLSLPRFLPFAPLDKSNKGNHCRGACSSKSRYLIFQCALLTSSTSQSNNNTLAY